LCHCGPDGIRRIESTGWSVRLSKDDPQVIAAGGQPCVVLRPEWIFITEDTSGETNRATGVIEDKIYLGVEYRLIVRSGGGEVVQLRNRDIARLAPLQRDDTE
jgi:putative spermidine/putrescine transport system ATP-binding protein